MLLESAGNGRGVGSLKRTPTKGLKRVGIENSVGNKHSVSVETELQAGHEGRRCQREYRAA